MTDSQWEIIKPILQEAKYRSLEEKREQINAVFYLVKTGCQWRNLPKDFPKETPHNSPIQKMAREKRPAK